MNPAVPRCPLKKLECAPALFEGQPDERGRRADEGAERHVGLSLIHISEPGRLTERCLLYTSDAADE